MSRAEEESRTPEAKYIVNGGVPSPACCGLIWMAISYLDTYGWTPMHRRAPNGAHDIIGALQAADKDQYPKTSPEYRMAVAAICRKISYEAIHMWEYDEGRYRTQDEAIELLQSVALEGAN